jgi:hypothetical protein
MPIIQLVIYKKRGDMFQANSVDQYLNFIKRYSEKEPFFRGQKEQHLEIPSTVARDEGYLQHENEIFYEAKKIAPHEFSDLKTPIECLSKMQHYVIPTRLICFLILKTRPHRR